MYEEIVEQIIKENERYIQKINELNEQLKQFTQEQSPNVFSQPVGIPNIVDPNQTVGMPNIVDPNQTVGIPNIVDQSQMAPIPNQTPLSETTVIPNIDLDPTTVMSRDALNQALESNHDGQTVLMPQPDQGNQMFR